jgi:hypothetical protein
VELSVDCSYGHARAENSLDDRDVCLTIEIVASSGEDRIVVHTRDDDEIAARPTEWACVSFARDAKLRAGVDAGGQRYTDHASDR